MRRHRFLMFFMAIIISVQAFAINSFASTATAFDHKEATALIGFIFNINPEEIREIEWDDNSIYKLLTGKYQKGSQEEAIAKIAFLSVAYENINQNIDGQNNTLNASRSHLLDYLEKHASGDIAGDMANGIIRNVLKSVSKCVMYDICGWDMDIIETFELSYDTIKDIKSLPNKAKAYAEKVQAAVVAGMEVASSNKRNMYMYFREYVNANVSMGEYADLYMEAYDLQLSQTILAYDPILNWHSENNIQTLKRWAKYVADVEISLSGQSDGDSDFVVKYVLNYPFAQDIVFYTIQDAINFIQDGMYKQTREGYTFVDWYYDAAGTIEYDGDFYEGMVLYAKWKKKSQTKFTITFNSNCSEVPNFSYIYDTTVGNWIDHIMTRPGYINAGWYWDSACTQPVTGTITINRNLTFYAKWVKQFTYSLSNNKATITGINGYQTYDGVTITDIEIPSTIDGYPVVAIGDRAFVYDTKITSIKIADGVTSIGRWAFYNCKSLSSITIPDSVTSIGDWAFKDCISLTSITIPDGVTSIGVSAFEYCSSLSSITIPDSVTSIGDCAFEQCISLTSITIPDGVTSIGYWMFRWCISLTSITIPDSVTIIDEGAFEYCAGLSSITIPDSVTSIGLEAFGYCNGLSSITIPDSVTSIGDSAFYNCKNLLCISVSENNSCYSSVDGVLFDKNKEILICCPSGKAGKYTIPDSVTSIEDSAFEACINLTSITIPSSVTNIGQAAFEGCDNLDTIYYYGTLTQWNNMEVSYNLPLEKNVIFVKHTKTEVSEDGKTFAVNPVNVEEGNAVIVALYKGGSFVEMQKAVYKSEELEFTTTKDYDTVKIMVWEDFENLIPKTEVEVLK